MARVALGVPVVVEGEGVVGEVAEEVVVVVVAVAL